MLVHVQDIIDYQTRSIERLKLKEKQFNDLTDILEIEYESSLIPRSFGFKYKDSFAYRSRMEFQTNWDYFYTKYNFDINKANYLQRSNINFAELSEFCVDEIGFFNWCNNLKRPRI